MQQLDDKHDKVRLQQYFPPPVYKPKSKTATAHGAANPFEGGKPAPNGGESNLFWMFHQAESNDFSILAFITLAFNLFFLCVLRRYNSTFNVSPTQLLIANYSERILVYSYFKQQF